MESPQRIIKNKLDLLNLAEELQNVSKACKIMGVSRDTFYRYKELIDTGGMENLIDKSRRKPNLKNRVCDETELAVINMAIEFPAFGQVRVSNELRKKGVFISACGVRCVWLRHDLESFKKRLKALEAKSAQDGILLTEAQLAALERAKQEKEAHGEIETECPGYLGSQDTYYVGTIKGIGRIYQQTFIDTYSRVTMAKLYTDKTPVTAADLLNDKVLPWFAEQNIPLLRILTDRGTEYCGKVEQHAYQLYLAVENIDHSRTKARSPQTNGIVERVQGTIKREFYDIIFRKKLITSVDDLQTELDLWLNDYNNLRPHSGRYCYGKTPMQTFRDSKHIAIEKNIGNMLRISDSSTYLAQTV